MASIGKWNAPRSVATVMSTELNGVAGPSMTKSSSPYDNTTNLDLYVDVEVVLGSLSPGTGSFIALYVGETVDGSNFPAQSAADMRLTSTQLLVVIPTGTATTTAQRIVARNVLIPPGKFDVYFDNQTTVSLNGTGNTVKFLAYNYNLNG